MIRTLANEQLTVVASYLPSTSAAFFAVALSSPSSSGELSEASKSILSNQDKSWEELDFTNMVKLSDEDLRGVLVCTDAKNKLKTLRLEGCSQIVGHGLEPLRESTVLERLDLPRFGNGLSIDIIIPLIVSMRSRYLHEENYYYPCLWKLLQNLRFPEEWASRDARNDQAFREELERINQFVPEEHRGAICFQCYRFCDDHDNLIAQCNNCGMTLCEGSCCNFKCCDGCQSCYCSTCAQLDNVDAAAHCGEQHCGDFCSACANTDCMSCVELHQVAPKLLDKNEELLAKNEEQAAEIVEMRNNIDVLTNENEQLRREIDELRKRKRDD